MSRDPHRDLEARKLELALRESNVQMADSALEQADRSLLAAHDAIAQVPPPADTVSRLIYAQTHAALAAAGYQQIVAKMGVEYERAQVSHERAHLDHADSERAVNERIERVRAEGMDALMQRFRDAGFDPQSIPGLGLMIPPPDEDRRDS